MLLPAMGKILSRLPKKQLVEFARQWEEVCNRILMIERQGDQVPVGLRRRRQRLRLITLGGTDECSSRTELARDSGVTRPTADLWLRRARTGATNPRVADARRPGRPRKLTAKDRKALLRAIRERKGRRRNRYSLAKLAEMYDVSRMTLSRLQRSARCRRPKQ